MRIPTAASRNLAPSTQPRVAAAAPSPAGRRLRGAALLTSVGFVCGAIFSHAVGFWTFMSEVALSGSAAAAHDAKAGDGSAAASLPTIYHIDPARCVSLELDRTANRTTPRPCPADGLALRLEPGEGREDITMLSETGAR